MSLLLLVRFFKNIPSLVDEGHSFGRLILNQEALFIVWGHFSGCHSILKSAGLPVPEQCCQVGDAGGAAPCLVPFPGSHLNSTAVINTLICSALMNSNPHYVLSKWAFTRLCATGASPGCGLGSCTNDITQGRAWSLLRRRKEKQLSRRGAVDRGRDDPDGRFNPQPHCASSTFGLPSNGNQCSPFLLQNVTPL